MSAKYAFTQTLKEVRFLFCQTAEHSAATRYASSPPTLLSAMVPLPRCASHIILTIGAFPPLRRSFLTRAYPIMKKNNPSTPIMLREAAGTLPKVYARYGR